MDYILEHYRCPECGWWHVGNRNVGTAKAPWQYRVVDREPALLVELGERATVHLLLRRNQAPRLQW